MRQKHFAKKFMKNVPTFSSNKIILEIAGFNIVLVLRGELMKYYKEAFYGLIFDKYKEFVVKGGKKTDFVIKLSPKNQFRFIEKKDGRGRRKIYLLDYIEDFKRKTIYTDYSLSQAKFEMILRQIFSQFLLPKTNGFFLHGSVAGYNDKAYIFMGQAGSGKSTTVKLLDGLCNILSDDSLIIRKRRGRFYYYQTPFYEKEWNFRRRTKPYEVANAFFIRKAPFFKIEKADDVEYSLKRVLNQLITEEGKIKYQFPVIAEFVKKTKFYRLYIKKDSSQFKNFFKKEVFKK